MFSYDSFGFSLTLSLLFTLFVVVRARADRLHIVAVGEGHHLLQEDGKQDNI